MTTEEARLYDVVKRVYNRHRDLASISPAWLATEAMVDIDFPRSLHETGYLGCHLQLRQIARSFCRKHFEPDGLPEDDAQSSLPFSNLQHRYPKVGSSADVEPEYVLLDLMTDADVAYNVARLRKEAGAKLAHADALEAWGWRKFAA